MDNINNKLDKMNNSYFKKEFQLSVNIYREDDYIYIIAPVAGIELENIDIEINEDTLTIRAKHEKKEKGNKEYFIQECNWRESSRSIILPLSVDSTKTKAFVENGILTISLPITNKKGKVLTKKLDL